MHGVLTVFDELKVEVPSAIKFAQGLREMCFGKIGEVTELAASKYLTNRATATAWGAHQGEAQ